MENTPDMTQEDLYYYSKEEAEKELSITIEAEQWNGFFFKVIAPLQNAYNENRHSHESLLKNLRNIKEAIDADISDI